MLAEVSFESIVNSDRYQALIFSRMPGLGLRVLLIQIGIKRNDFSIGVSLCLRVLLIQIGIKLKILLKDLAMCLRVLLIQIGIKHNQDR